jgi:recombination endonuclease VII
MAAFNSNKTRCVRGHEFTIENTYVCSRGTRKCRSCMRIHGAKQRANKTVEQIEQDRQYQREYRAKASPLKAQEYRLRHTYGVELETYNDMFYSQNKVCAISGLSAPEGQVLHLDHDHTTGKVRQLLHPAINKALGVFQDNPEWLRRAADYIEFWRANDIGGVATMAAKA